MVYDKNTSIIFLSSYHLRVTLVSCRCNSCRVQSKHVLVIFSATKISCESIFGRTKKWNRLLATQLCICCCTKSYLEDYTSKWGHLSYVSKGGSIFHLLSSELFNHKFFKLHGFLLNAGWRYDWGPADPEYDESASRGDSRSCCLWNLPVFVECVFAFN